MTNQMVLEMEAVCKSFKKDNNKISVLKSVTLALAEAKSLAILGQSGSGKSTLLQLAGSLMKPDGGIVSISGVEVSSRSENELSKIRMEAVGFVFQFHHLIPEFNVIDNVIMPNLIAEKKPNYKRSLFKKI